MKDITRVFLFETNAAGTHTVCDIFELTAGYSEALAQLRSWSNQGASHFMIQRGFEADDGSQCFPFPLSHRTDHLTPIGRQFARH